MPKIAVTVKNIYKNDKTRIAHAFNQQWIILINQLEQNAPPDLQTKWGEV